MGEVLVYDPDGNGRIIAEFLESEMPIKVDYLTCEAPRELRDLSSREIFERAKEDLGAFVGEYRAIVLASPVISMVAKEKLEEEFLRQKFVGCGGPELEEGLSGVGNVVMLIPERMKRVVEYQELKAKCQRSVIAEPDCERWVRLLDGGWIEIDKLKEELGGICGSKVVVCHPEILERADRLQEIFDWRGELVDARRGVLSEVKTKLGMAWS